MTDANGPRKTRVAVLGGGQAALTAAFQLTDPANPRRDEFDVTIYQVGWRIGGKGATGRNTTPGFGSRIEEHGFHNWFGFYDNSFRQIRDCYRQLARAPGTPLASWREAFIPAHRVAFMEGLGERKSEWTLHAPPNDEEPGVGSGLLPLREYVLMFVEALHEHFHPTSGGDANRPPPRAAAGGKLTTARSLARMMSRQDESEHRRHHGVVPPRPHQLLQRLSRTVLRLIPETVLQRVEAGLARAVSRLLRAFMGELWKYAQPRIEQDEVRREWILANFAFGCVAGIIDDDLLRRGLNAVNDQDFRPWLAGHAFPDGDLMMSSPVLRSVYDSSFAYENGDTSIPPGAAFPPAASYEAGIVLRGAIRGLFTYRGALTYRFAAGTGDSCYAPMYEVLERRGVKFKFFHRVEELQPGPAPGSPIERIRIARQVDLRRENGATAYAPLISVKGLPCWPNRPRYEQLERGAELERAGIDLEDPPADFENAGVEILQRGRDFDAVVLGIPVAAHPTICAPLLAQSERWRLMTSKLKSVRTQALQTWSNRTVAELGWKPPGRDIASVLWEYDQNNILNVWGDLTEVARWEDWPAGGGPGNIAYFCGPMREDAAAPQGEPQPRPTATTERGKVREAIVNLLSNGVGVVWTDACRDVGGRREFRWEALVDPRPGAQDGERRLDAQYFRANVSDSERYVLSVPGSGKFRLPANAADEFPNLYLAGDWTQCALDCGCMEAATISGMLCASALSGFPLRESISGLEL